MRWQKCERLFIERSIRTSGWRGHNILRFVGDNSQEPGPERRPCPKSVQAIDRLDHRYLGGVAGIVRISGDDPRCAKGNLLIKTDEVFDGLPVAERCLADQLLFVD